MHYLTKVDVEEFEDIKSGYRIHFHFTINPFFENTLLTKEFCLGGTSGPMSKSTAIEWKDGKDISKSQLKQKQDDQQANKRKRHYETKTFFDWFSDNSDPVNDDIAELLKGMGSSSGCFCRKAVQETNIDLVHFCFSLDPIDRGKRFR